MKPDPADAPEVCPSCHRERCTTPAACEEAYERDRALDLLALEREDDADPGLTDAEVDAAAGRMSDDELEALLLADPDQAIRVFDRLRRRKILRARVRWGPDGTARHALDPSAPVEGYCPYSPIKSPTAHEHYDRELVAQGFILTRTS